MFYVVCKHGLHSLVQNNVLTLLLCSRYICRQYQSWKNNDKTKTDNDGLIGGVAKEALDDIVTGITDGILDIAGIKESHNTRFGTYTNVEGFTRNVDVDNANDYKVTYTYDLTKLSDADITALGVNKDYNALKKSYTDRGLTCK